MKRSFKALIAMTLVLALSLAMPVFASTATQKPAQPKITKASAVYLKEAIGLKYTWKKVSGVNGYQIRYKVFADGDYKTKNVKAKTSAKIGFQDYGTIVFQVRAYVTEGGKKFYGKWATKSLTRAKVAALLNKK